MLKLSVEKIEDIAEPLRELYEEKDGKFRLKVDGIDADYVPRDALKRANDESAARRKELDTWKKLGKSEEEIRDLIAAAQKAEEDKAKKAGDHEKIRQALIDNHTKEMEAERGTTKAMRSTLERYLIDAQATASIAAAKGSSDLLLPHVQKNVRVIEENPGEYVAVVVDAKGEPRINGKGERMSVADLVGEMRQSDIYGRAFEGSGHSGSGMRPATGTNGGTPGTKSIPRAEFIALSPVDQMAKVKAGFTITEPPQ